MNAYCPECETDLDQTTGICPACRWDPIISQDPQAVETDQEPEMSLTERYRGSEYDIAMVQAAVGHAPNTGVSRGRAFVVVGLVSGAIMYGIGLAIMGPF